MADVVACMALSAITRRIRPQLLLAGLCAPLEVGPGRRMFGTSIPLPQVPFQTMHIGIVDDECFPVLAAANVILANLAQTMAEVHSAYEKNGVRIHLRPGKTAALIRPGGPGSALLRRVAAPLYADGLPFADLVGGRLDLRLCVARS